MPSLFLTLAICSCVKVPGSVVNIFSGSVETLAINTFPIQISCVDSRKYIVLASFESLNIGLGYSLLPLLLNDKDLVMIDIYKEIDLYSIFNTIIKEVKIGKNNILHYKEKTHF